MRTVATIAAFGVLVLATNAHARDGFNKGMFNKGMFNKGMFNKGMFNKGMFNKGMFNTAGYSTGAYNSTYSDGVMEPDVVKTGDVAVGEWDFLGSYPVTPGETLSVQMTGSGDPDLYVKFGDSDYRTFNCRPYVGGAVENCSIAVPTTANTAYVSVNGYAAGTYSVRISGHDRFVNLNTGYLNPGNASKTRLRASGTVTQGQWAVIGSFPVTPGTTFKVRMTGTSDADLYVKFGSEPSDASFDCRPYIGGSVETCDLVVPQGAAYAVVEVAGYAASSTFALDILDFNMGVGGMVSSYGYAVDNVSLGGTALYGATWVYGLVEQCEEPYGCWEEWAWTYDNIGPHGFIGATQQVTITDEDQRVVGTATTRIAAVNEHGANALDAEKSYTYSVDVQVGSRDAAGNVTYSWQPFCGRDLSNNPIQALPLQGSWNYQAGAVYGGDKISWSANHITWACLDAALGKGAASHAIVLPDNQGTGYGYMPHRAANVWKKQSNWICVDTYRCYWSDEWVLQTSTLSMAHQASIRMIRADYCGDGVAHTVSGRHLDVWDMLPSKVNTKGVDYTRDASWTFEGANDFGCNGRVDALWTNTCQPGQVYCEAKCPVYTYQNGSGQTVTSQPKEFGMADSGAWRCLAQTSYSTGGGFNRNELVNTSENWGSTADKSIARSLSF